MTLHRTLAMASAIAMAFGLTACAGAGVTEIASALPLPPPPLPPPPPPPVTVTVSAPAAASAPAVPAFPQAVAGGPTIAAPGSTVLPLLQAVQVATTSTSTIGPDTATMNGGATLILDPGASRATLNVVNSAVGVSNAVLTRGPQTVFYETSGSTVIRLEFAALEWTAYGSWLAYPGGTNPVTTGHTANFVTGFQTPGSAVPTTGSASYTGNTFGYVYTEAYPGVSDTLAGTVDLLANFANGTIIGTLTNMIAGDPWYTGAYPWNSVSLSASFAGGQSVFAGTTAVTSAPGNSLSLAANATGTLVGSFFGPAAQELGAVWTLFDGTRSATGTIGARSGP